MQVNSDKCQFFDGLTNLSAGLQQNSENWWSQIKLVPISSSYTRTSQGCDSFLSESLRVYRCSFSNIIINACLFKKFEWLAGMTFPLLFMTITKHIRMKKKLRRYNGKNISFTVLNEKVKGNKFEKYTSLKNIKIALKHGQRIPKRKMY